jgi:hypothetical protein
MSIISNLDEEFAIIINKEHIDANYLKDCRAEIIPVEIKRGIIGYITSFGVYYKLFKHRPDIEVLHYHFMSYYLHQ